MKVVNADELAADLRGIANKIEESILEITELDDYDMGVKSGFSRAAILTENYPAFDAEPVIRCKDCKFRPIKPEGYKESEVHNLIYPLEDVCPLQCGDPWYNSYPDDDFYCARGIMKEVCDGQQATQ